MYGTRSKDTQTSPRLPLKHIFIPKPPLPPMKNALIATLSTHERTLISHLNKPYTELTEATGLEEATLVKTLLSLETKGLLILKTTKKTLIDTGVNGIRYARTGLPERKLLSILKPHHPLPLLEAQKVAGLSENEYNVSLGILKSKGMISLDQGAIVLTASPAECMKKTLEEQLIEKLPLVKETLTPELVPACIALHKRKDIIELKEHTERSYTLTPLGKELAGTTIESNVLEEVTPELIRNWQGAKQFRAYDLSLPVAPLTGGKRHFVNEAIEKAVRIWTDMGFTEMTGTMIDNEFWVFDALYTPQDHPGREMQDTFFLPLTRPLPETKLIKRVQQAHEQGIVGSTGWQYTWSPKKAQQAVLRTHTTSLSARTVATLKTDNLPAKYFAIGKVFRNETVDWSHGFEFYQTEGIVIDEKATFCHLLGYLTEFYTKMGFEKIKFVPSFFPYTEPSVEIQVWHPSKKIWLELGGAGIFRPEVSAALIGKPIPILAWGQGFDRIIMDAYKITDLRDMYRNNLKQLRTMPRGGLHG